MAKIGEDVADFNEARRQVNELLDTIQNSVAVTTQFRGYYEQIQNQIQQQFERILSSIENSEKPSDIQKLLDQFLRDMRAEIQRSSLALRGGGGGAVPGAATEATLTAMKGVGWTNESLKAIKDVVDGLGGGAGTATIEKQNQILDGTVDLSGGWAAGTDNLHDIYVKLEVLDDLVDDLETRLTAVRAGYLDNLNQAGLLQITAARGGYLDNINQAGLLQVTAVRAALLDNLDVAVSTRLAAASYTAERGTDNAALAATALSNVDWTAARAAAIDELLAVNLPTDIDLIKADTPYITDLALPVGPVANSLAYRLSQFLADGDGDFATGTPLPANTSLYDILHGANGISVWNAAAAPGNNVSMAEVLRAVYDDTNELQGDWVNGGRLDLILDLVATQANLTLLQADVGDASAATLLSLYGILGNPATTITAQITDAHDHASTAATQATNAAADAVLLKADVGDASAATLGSLYGILGNPAATSISVDVAATHAHAALADSEATAAHVDAGTAATQATNAAADAVLLKADVGDASAATLTSIYGILGNPATTVTAQITDAHDHASTAATQATNAAADAVLLKADVGDASAATLLSLYGILGNPATTITAQITDAHDHAATAATQSTNAAADAVLLKADLGDASASTKGSVYGILGNPAANSLTVTLENIHDTDLPDLHTDVGTAITAIGDMHATDLPAVKAETALIVADTGELQTDWVNGGRLDLLIDAIKARTDNRLTWTTFFSLPVAEVVADTTHTDAAMPTVTIPNWTGTIVHVYVGFKCRKIENTNAAANKLSGAQEIQVNKAGGAWTDGINLVDDMFGMAATTIEPGDAYFGIIDLVATIDVFNTTCQFQWDEPLTDQDALHFNDLQTFVIIGWY
jgi:hypothetical protein